MEPHESGLSSYYHHQQQQPPPQPPPQQSPTSAAAAAAVTTSTTIASPTNGTLPPHTAYPNSVSSTVTPGSDAGKRKRGRPRKYSTPEEAAAARKAMLSSSIPKKKKKDKFLGTGDAAAAFAASYQAKKSQLASPGVGNVGQGFAPHTLNVAAGEDVYQKIMLFMQQSKCEICILSASGSISNPSLRQPASFGGNITYEGRFDILSLSGSYIHTELGGRSGGLSVCLSSSDGQIIGGGIGGPLKAAGPVQVIVGTFVIDAKKDTLAGMKGDASFPKFQSPVGGTLVS